MTRVSKRRVGVDGFNLALPQGTGVATYARTLSQALTGMGYGIDLVYGLDVPSTASLGSRETLFFGALADGRSGGEPPERTTAWGRVRRQWLSPATRDLVEVPVSGRVPRASIAGRIPAFERVFTLNRIFHLGGCYLRRYGRLLPVRMPDPPEIMHWTYPVPVRLVGARNVYTIHDLVPLRLPFLSLEDKAYHERLLRECVATAAHVLTVSEVSRQDILTYLPVSPDRVTNIYQAVVARHCGPDDEDALAHRLRTMFGLELRGYFLFYGAIEPKKNVARLIEAYLAADTSTPLIVAGPQSWGGETELRLLDGAQGVLPGTHRIRRIDYLPADHLDTLLRGARVLAFPSLYEGFGLPVVEAMQAGVPVLAGNAGSLPEIVGDAGLLVDPYDVDAIRAALLLLDGDTELRAQLVAKGRARAADFAMRPYQARLRAVHARLLATPVDRGSFVRPSQVTAAVGELT